ncbi:MAG: hypothetical protein R2695_20380 [Acidimicrobiales bacterium]
MRRVGQLLAEHPLVTITATGGAGKTRLAIEVAAGEPGAGFVDLVAAHDPLSIARQVAEGAGVDMDGIAATAGLDGVREHTARHVGATARLLVFDNCEHALDAVRAEAEWLLDRCPNLRILATSRERLRRPRRARVATPADGLRRRPLPSAVEAHGVALDHSEEVDEMIAVVQATRRSPAGDRARGGALLDSGLGERPAISTP